MNVSHSSVTKKGRGNVSNGARRPPRAKASDNLKSAVQVVPAGAGAHPGAASLKGALASDRGKGLSFAQIRSVSAAERKRDRAL